MPLHEYRLDASIGAWVPVLGGGARRLVAVTPPPPPPPDPGGSNGGADPALWALDFDDDFTLSGTGNAAVEPTRWTVRNNTSNSNESSYLLSANVSAANSVLSIVGKLQSVGGKSYTSGYIDSNGKYSTQANFRALVRARVPFTQGMWAAPLWFRPTDAAGAYEIDLLETYGREINKAHYTLHAGTNYTTDHVQSAWTKTLPDPEGWHTWVIEKTPGLVVMYLDNTEQQRFTPADRTLASRWTAAFESGRRWSLRCNLQIGGSWGGEPDGTTNWNDSTMQVDRIATWRYVGS